MAAAAGANALVSGSFLFGAPPDRMRDRIEILERALLEHGD
jgi:pentose-5-phosphate-3-epimerase